MTTATAAGNAVCSQCCRANCRVVYWQRIVDTGQWHGVARDRADAELALASAKVSCFVRSGIARRSGTESPAL